MQEQPFETNPASAWHWGEYALDPARRQLTRGGEPVEIEDRVYDLLVLLLRRREQSLDRQEIVGTIWGKRPVSDATLRQLVYAARRAVGDDGDHQHTISTLYGRGLQWVAPVEMVFETDGGGHDPQRVQAAPSDDDAEEKALPVPAPVAARPHRRRLWLGLAVAALLLAGAGAWFGVRWAHRDAEAVVHASPRVAIEPFTNATGDASLDWVRNGLPGLIGSLLDDAGGLDVVDGKQVARALKFKPTQGRNQVQQLRFVTGADALVSGQLAKLADNLYELTLHVQTAEGDPTDIRVDGERPGALAATAVSRLRRSLRVAGRSVFRGKLPSDPFLAEAFARGVDLAAHGKYADAQSFFAICVKGAPDYLPARLRLGDAQMLANDMQAGEKTLRDLLVLAQKRDDARMAARALFDLGLLEANRGQADLALRSQQQAVAYAHRGGDAEFEIGAHLVAAAAAIKLNQPDVSARELDAGKRLLAQHPNFRRAKGVMYDVEGIIAFGKGDHAAMMAALRASLALNESLGDERKITNSLNNLATGLDYAGQPLDSLAMIAHAYVRIRDGQYRELEFQIGETLDEDLWKIGLDKQSLAASNALLTLAQRENSKPWQVTVLHHVASVQLAQGDAAAALASVRKADAVMAPDAMSSDLYLDARMLEARAAFAAEPAVLPQIGAQLDAYVTAHAGNTGSGNAVQAGLRRQLLVHALAYAAAGQVAKASSSLREADSARFRDGLDDSELRHVALAIANANGDKVAADIAWGDFDVATAQNGGLLARYAQWARKHGDAAGAQRAEQRLAQLQKQGRDALVAAGLNPEHPLGDPVASAPPATSG